MLFGFNLHDLFLFPVQDKEARKHFLIGSLLYLACFIIPVIPWLIVAGYNGILIRQVLNGEKPHLVPWENWETLFKDGARLIGIRLIYASPLLLLMIPLFLVSFAFPFFSIFTQNPDSQSALTSYYFFILIMIAISFLIVPLSIAVALIVPAAEIHSIRNEDFAAGFRYREWWPIFKANWVGFVVAVAILYGISMMMSLAMQFLMMTIVLLCLLPLLLPVISMYSAVVQYTAFAQAYKEGKEKIVVDVAPT